jgi:hypothetical protein
MKRYQLLTLCVALCVILSTQAHADFFASTDRVSYTGTVTRYGTLADAQSGANATGTYAIPDRVTDAPYNTGYRDAGIFFSSNAPNYSTNSNIFLTAWWYSTVENTNGKPKDDTSGDRYYSGWGNPNNNNTGFIQLYDGDGSTSTAAKGYFSNYSGGYYRNFNLQVAGGGADYANDWARLWQAPGVGGAGNLTQGIFHSYNLNITFGGLQGSLLPGGWIEANNHPDSVTGTFTAIFQNTNTADSQYHGYYAVNYTFGLDNWAYGQGNDALNGDFSSSQFAAPVPIPAAFWLLGSGLVGLVGLRRRLTS